MKKILLVFLLIGVALSACASGENNRPLIGSWRLTAYGPVDSTAPAVPDVEATLNFTEDGSLTGDTGCNQFGGNYILEGNQLTFDNIVSTLILCPELQMAQEEAIQRVLTETATFNIEGDTLTIINNDTVLVFTADT